MAKKVFVGLSGGVDSAVAAAFLRDEGYDVHGIFIKAWEDTDALSGACPWQEDQEMVGRVASHLGIPWETWNMTSEYAESVLEYFFSEYQRGRTPNPDVMCNEKIKFGVFYDRARAAGAEYVATGHYARISSSEGVYTIQKGVDKDKDQSYFLYRIASDRLSHVLFPIGGYTKTEIREKAASLGLPNADRPDSQGICFIGQVKVEDFIRRRLSARPGPAVDSQGNVVGIHAGSTFLTVGQRHGMRISGDTPYYVAKKITDKNTVVLARGSTDPILYTTRAEIEHIVWHGVRPVTTVRCTAKIRYRQPDQHCAVTLQKDMRATIEFDEPQRAISPGQSVVLYTGDDVLGGGILT